MQVLRNLVQKASKSEARMGRVYPAHMGGPEPIQNHLLLLYQGTQFNPHREKPCAPATSLSPSLVFRVLQRLVVSHDVLSAEHNVGCTGVFGPDVRQRCSDGQVR